MSFLYYVNLIFFSICNIKIHFKKILNLENYNLIIYLDNFLIRNYLANKILV